MRVTTGLIGLKGRFTGFQGLRKCRSVPPPARAKEKERKRDRERERERERERDIEGSRGSTDLRVQQDTIAGLSFSVWQGGVPLTPGCWGNRGSLGSESSREAHVTRAVINVSRLQPP